VERVLKKKGAWERSGINQGLSQQQRKKMDIYGEEKTSQEGIHEEKVG